MSTEAFSETLQFITNVKLQELEKRHKKFTEHSDATLNYAKSVVDPIAKLKELMYGMQAWPGGWSSNLSRSNITQWLEQASRDPGFPPSIVQDWIRQAEAEYQHERTRFDYAHLFGNLLTEWLKASHRMPKPTEVDSESVVDGETSEGFEKVNRKETLEQKKKLESLIFEEKIIDVPALESYLSDLFSSKDAHKALLDLRARIGRFARELRSSVISSSDVETVIASTLGTDVLSDEKQALLKQFVKNPTVVQELASVLTMQLQSLQSWSWPVEGVSVEPRRHLNGKTRFYLDTEILTCLLLHYIGTSWAVEFRHALESLKNSMAWKNPLRFLTKNDLDRREVFLGKVDSTTTSIASVRRRHQSDHFFMCLLPKSSGSSVNHYNDESPSVHDSEPRFDTPIELKQSLLHIISTDIIINETLRETCTVVRTDLEWFGPSLPFDTITTVLRFFGMPEQEVQFFRSFLACPVVFRDDPTGVDARTRRRGVPIGYMLSTLFGELTMFVMDFCVNQRADGLFLYRIHDDFWFCDWDATRCVQAWEEMNRYAALAGLAFNASKTGSVCVGKDAVLDARLPVGDVRWGFLRMDSKGVFVIDQEMVDTHIAEMRRQLAATTSVFGWTQAYNKYMAFVVRNCGQPAIVYGTAHIDGIIDTVARIQRELFPSTSEGGSEGGSFVRAVANMLDAKFGMDTSDVPLGWYLWPNAAGGLEVRDPFVGLLSMRSTIFSSSKVVIEDAYKQDEMKYEFAKARWEALPSYEKRSTGSGWASKEVTSPVHVNGTDTNSSLQFFSFDEFTKAREERGWCWYNAYTKMLQRPTMSVTVRTPEMTASLQLLGRGVGAFGGAANGVGLSPYWQWIIGLHHDEMVRKFGSLAVVESGSIPVGMVDVFKSSRMRWEQ